MELVDLIADYNRVTGIVTAVIPHNVVSVLGETIDDLSLSLVTPMHTDNNYI